MEKNYVTGFRTMVNHMSDEEARDLLFYIARSLDEGELPNMFEYYNIFIESIGSCRE